MPHTLKDGTKLMTAQDLIDLLQEVDPKSVVLLDGGRHLGYQPVVLDGPLQSDVWTFTEGEDQGVELAWTGPISDIDDSGDHEGVMELPIVVLPEVKEEW